MIVLDGTVQSGVQHWTQRLTTHSKIFAKATGETLFPGTVNVNVGRHVQIREHFRVYGYEIGEPEDFLFEVCRINGIWAYRVRPLDSKGGGGAGDNVLEITSKTQIPGVQSGAKVKIELLRNGSLLDSGDPLHLSTLRGPVLHP